MTLSKRKGQFTNIDNVPNQAKERQNGSIKSLRNRNIGMTPKNNPFMTPRVGSASLRRSKRTKLMRSFLGGAGLRDQNDHKNEVWVS